jgi:DNA-binding GntR family transcriptional regulator
MGGTGLLKDQVKSIARLLDHDLFGIVSFKKNGGALVKRPTRDELVELMDLRITLETEAAERAHRGYRLAGETSDKPINKNNVVLQLENIFQDLETISATLHRPELEHVNDSPLPNASPDARMIASENFWQRDIDLHQAIFHSVHMNYASSFASILRDRMRIYGSRGDVVSGRITEAQREHAKLIAAIKAQYEGPQSLTAVRTAVAEHLNNSRAFLLRSPEAPTRPMT